jgi:hypothetical protein
VRRTPRRRACSPTRPVRSATASDATTRARVVLGEGGPKDARAARRAFERGCSLDNGEACFALGVALHQGDGGVVDRARALEVWTRACTLDFANACVNAASMYKGGGTASDTERAKQLSAKACSLGVRELCTSTRSPADCRVECEKLVRERALRDGVTVEQCVTTICGGAR